ncbi:hypothetical protein CEE37_04285 [candidate division LCP-89 bacterium B3_LCP]|uniref:Uncharacterized protein n=1 Tax=candidate division LCP-89 bacterium B3_LCP TaxID=2012998 RepID=A0A532V3K1_UNCL8|nr:MAG: hypothetical protein CEE37_04285 [candidate division LCP-89 bacterium B3_LCP]
MLVKLVITANICLVFVAFYCLFNGFLLFGIGAILISFVLSAVSRRLLLRRKEIVLLDFYQKDSRGVRRNFLNYCGAFLMERCGLDNTQANLLVHDPELGEELDSKKRDWLDLISGKDPDELLIPKAFDAPEMEIINETLLRYAKEFPKRMNKIKEYLRTIGHPYGDL